MPDDAARAEWIATLVATARTIVREQIAPPAAAGLLVERPTLLPVPGELADNDPAAVRLRRPGTPGPPALRPAGRRPAPAARRCRPCWTRRGCSSTTSAPIIRPPWSRWRRSRPGRRTRIGTLKLLGVRAQIYLGLGDLERARATIAYLNAAQPRRAGRVEAVPDGLVWIPEPDPGAGWPAFLAERAEALAATAGPAARPPRRAARSDRPAPDLVLDPADLPLPVLAPPPDEPLRSSPSVPSAPAPAPRGLPRRERRAPPGRGRGAVPASLVTRTEIRTIWATRTMVLRSPGVIEPRATTASRVRRVFFIRAAW